MRRAACICETKRSRDVRYRLHLNLTGGSGEYQAKLDVNFASNASALQGVSKFFLDFVGKEITSLKFNNQELSAGPLAWWSSNRLHFSPSLLASENHISVEYTNEYNHDGEGFHQFVDPEDKEEYLYTNFEPFEAHRLLPCFDQPDIKARPLTPACAR
jgi:aminopeptidase N